MCTNNHTSHIHRSSHYYFQCKTQKKNFFKNIFCGFYMCYCVVSSLTFCVCGFFYPVHTDTHTNTRTHSYILTLPTITAISVIVVVLLYTHKKTHSYVQVNYQPSFLWAPRVFFSSIYHTYTLAFTLSNLHTYICTCGWYPCESVNDVLKNLMKRFWFFCFLQQKKNDQNKTTKY